MLFWSHLVRPVKKGAKFSPGLDPNDDKIVI